MLEILSLLEIGKKSLYCQSDMFPPILKLIVTMQVSESNAWFYRRDKNSIYHQIKVKERSG